MLTFLSLGVAAYAVLPLGTLVLRVYMPVSMVAGVPFDIAYPIVAWLCWVPNLLVAERLFDSRQQHNHREEGDGGAPYFRTAILTLSRRAVVRLLQAQAKAACYSEVANTGDEERTIPSP